MPSFSASAAYCDRILPRHQVSGEIIIQCLEGCLRIELDECNKDLNAGELLFLAGNAPHGVTALVTIALVSATV